MDDLIAFLRARLDDDEQLGEIHTPDCEARNLYGWEFVCRCDLPARRSADIAAKRRIVDAYENATRIAAQGHNSAYAAGELAAYETAVRALALADSHHPDYRAEWRPGDQSAAHS
ncbi:DUF6221 family protein [Amycolatopsis thermoflava]|uniref:DUF6221 family protein n=1 Tax=Amycolatopsis thermoflava TaxID=84480 RepID=UPI003EC14947